MRTNKFLQAASVLAIGAALLVGAPFGNAEVHSRSKEIVVLTPADLPELAQRPGEAMHLYDTTDGRTFLYIEQHHGQRLVVFDVTDPTAIKESASVKLPAPHSFDFVRPLGDSAELIRFRNGAGVAVLDLKRPKAPAMKTINGMNQAGHTEAIGDTGFLMVNEPYNFVNPVAHDYQVVDTSSPADPVLLATVTMVKQQVSNDQTGTLFLLGNQGLTVVRRPQVEEERRMELLQQSSN